MPPNADEYGERYADHYLEQYKLFVEMTDRVGQRRDQANRFYGAIFSALAAVLLVAARFQLSGGTWEVVFLAVGVIGAALAVIWFLTLHSYRSLNAAKFDVIYQMEEKLPFAPYDAEWKILEPTYRPLSKMEQGVSLVLAAASLALASYAVFLMAT